MINFGAIEEGQIKAQKKKEFHSLTLSHMNFLSVNNVCYVYEVKKKKTFSFETIREIQLNFFIT